MNLIQSAGVWLGFSLKPFFAILTGLELLRCHIGENPHYDIEMYSNYPNPRNKAKIGMKNILSLIEKNMLYKTQIKYFKTLKKNLNQRIGL